MPTNAKPRNPLAALGITEGAKGRAGNAVVEPAAADGLLASLNIRLVRCVV